jgi:hypothetical protein
MEYPEKQDGLRHVPADLLLDLFFELGDRPPPRRQFADQGVGELAVRN